MGRFLCHRPLAAATVVLRARPCWLPSWLPGCPVGSGGRKYHRALSPKPGGFPSGANSGCFRPSIRLQSSKRVDSDSFLSAYWLPLWVNVVWSSWLCHLPRNRAPPPYASLGFLMMFFLYLLFPPSSFFSYGCFLIPVYSQESQSIRDC